MTNVAEYVKKRILATTDHSGNKQSVITTVAANSACHEVRETGFVAMQQIIAAVLR